MQTITNVKNSFSEISFDQKNRIVMRRCNLCNERFHAHAYERFCYSCRESEELKFSDWLPDLEVEHYEKRSA